jgi:hypothetical protein
VFFLNQEGLKMAELSRITLGNIDNIIDESGVEELGRGTVGGSCWDGYLRLKVSGDTKKINMSKSGVSIAVWEMRRNTFLECVNKVLEDNEMYLADVEYRADRWEGFFPHRLSGKFYRKKE